MNKLRTPMALVVMLCLALLGNGASAKPNSIATGMTSALLQYQGRLSEPGSGEVVADGTYTMTFRLYTTSMGGTALWTEIKGVSVTEGLFSVVLGTTSPLDHDVFNGRKLWLGIKVGADEEATPRQQILPVAYALSIIPGATIEASSESPTLTLVNEGAGPALHSDGAVVVKGALTVEGTLSGGAHTHDGAELVSGLLSEERIPDEIARDTDLAQAVQTHSGESSAHHDRYSDAEAASAALNHPEIVTEYELLDHIHGDLHSGRAIASGVINDDGTIFSATSNVTSRWDTLCKCYEIALDGHTYEWREYVTIITPVFGGGIPNAWSVDGKLNIGIYGLDTEPQQLPFQFVTYKPQAAIQGEMR